MISSFGAGLAQLNPQNQNSRLSDTPPAISAAIETMISTQLRMAAALERFASAPSPKAERTAKEKKGHGRGGEKWTAEEDEAVAEQFESGRSVDEIARRQRRSWVAIIARLEYIGYVPRNLRLADLERDSKNSRAVVA